MKKYTKILVLTLCCALLLSAVAFAADSVKKTIEATYRGIKLVVDGVPVTPKDAKGNVVEPFIYNGTTYLPVRAVGEALGKTVSWDGATSTVYVGNVPGKDIYLLDVCPPYETYNYKSPEIMTVMGKNYTKAFSLSDDYMSDAFALFNLDGAYQTLSFDVGHLDGTNRDSRDIKIYLDGELTLIINTTGDMMLTHYDLPLNGALQMKIYIDDASAAPGYAFVNAILTK